MSSTNIKNVVKEKYGQAALRVKSGGSACCGATAASGLGCDPITSNLYDSSQAGQVPEEAMLASLGCGNPTALAKLNAGEVVLDLGSGGGVDVLLSAKRVGPTGKAYGLDMTDEMLALANENKRKAGADNVEFLKGEIEHIPAAGQLGRRNYLELRNQPFSGQRPCIARSLSRAEAGRPLCGFRRCDPRRNQTRNPPKRASVGRLCSGGSRR